MTENNNGIKIDLEQVRKMARGDRERAGKPRIDLNTIREYDYEDTILEKIQNKGKMTVQDMMMLQMWEDMRAQKKGNIQPQVNVEEIIQKATQPFREQVEEMKRQLQKQEEDRKQEGIQKQIEDLRNLILTTNKRPTEDDPILKKIESLENELKGEKERSSKKEQENFQKRIEDMIYDLSDRMENLKQTPESKDKVQQIIEIEKEKQNLLKALGVAPNKDGEQMGVAELADAVIDRVPRLAKTASTVREIFSKDDSIPDDIPEDVPSSLPQRNKPINNKPVIPEDIRSFLDKGREKGGQYIDYTGIGWTDEKGNPLSRREIEDMSLVDPTAVRRFISEADRDYAQKKDKGELSDERLPEPKKSPKVHTPPVDDIQVNKSRDKDDIPELPNEKPVETPLPPEVLDYIRSGEEKQDEQGNTVWVGRKNEVYTTESGKLATKSDLMEEAKKDPKAFMDDVRSHLASLSENNPDENQENDE